MTILWSGNLLAALKFLSAFSAAKIGIAATLFVWHQAIFCNGAHRLRSLAAALPFLALELRLRLNVRNWLTQISRLARRHGSRNLPPPAPSMEFLLWRDGHSVIDFYKTLSFSGASPPAFA